MKFQVILKSLETIINQTKADVNVSSEGKVTKVIDGVVIVEDMMPYFTEVAELTIEHSSAPTGSFYADGWTWENRWVKEFVALEVPAEEPTDPRKFNGAKGELLEVTISCCGWPLFFLKVDGTEVSYHIDSAEQAKLITESIMDLVTGCYYGPNTFKGRYKGETIEVRKSCSGEPMLIIENEDESEVFHIMGGKADAERINKLIMDVYR